MNRKECETAPLQWREEVPLVAVVSATPQKCYTHENGGEGGGDPCWGMRYMCGREEKKEWRKKSS